MCRGEVQALQIADGLSDASAEQGEESAADDCSTRDRSAVTGAVVRADGGSNAKPNRSADKNVSGVPMVPPRSFVGSSGIWALGWKWTPGYAAAKLWQRWVGCVRIDVGGLRVFNPRLCNRVDVASLGFTFSSMIFCRLSHRARGKRESSEQ
jgi:hypothetical protein